MTCEDHDIFITEKALKTLVHFFLILFSFQKEVGKSSLY